MFRYRSCLLWVCVCGLSLSSAAGQDDGNKAFLLNVGKGQIPDDTGLGDKTVMSLVDSTELGGKAVKVVLAPEDSFGVSTSAVPNWKKSPRLRMKAFNPGAKPIELELNIVHSRSTNYSTRVVQDIKLNSGTNDITVALDNLKNVNGSAPDFANVTRWYFADATKAQSTFFVGDIWLEGGDAAPAPIASATAAPSFGGSPLIGYRVKGKVGTMEIDLTLAPFLVSPSGSAIGAKPAGSSPTAPGAPATAPVDSARLARIRSARMPSITDPINFDTPEADAIVAALEVFPPDNPLYLDVSNWPVHPNSQNIIASIGADKPLRYNTDMGYLLVPPNQEKIDVRLGEIAEESDKGPYPVPETLPIEQWPVGFQRENAGLTLDQVQRNVKNDDGDRHAIVVDPVNRLLYEFYQMKKTNNGWQATQASIFDLKTNKLRPNGWTSSDAAGLPIFPYVARYDELKRGAVEHALRVTVVKTRRAFVYPATHYASQRTDANLPRMGERIRLRKDYDVSAHSPEVQTILKSLQKFGMLVADNGIDWALSVTPDPRIPELHAELRKVQGANFEVVEPPAGYSPPTR